MPRPSRRIFHAIGVATIIAAGCGSPQEPAPEQPAALERARIPTVVPPDTDFRLVAYFVHGICDEARPVVELTSTGATLGLMLRPVPVPPGSACPDIALVDSVDAVVKPPFTLPYTVRLLRPEPSDSVIVVRASDPTG